MRIGGMNPQIAQLSQATSGLTQGFKAEELTKDSGADFGEMLKDALAEVNGMQGQSRQMQNDFLEGKNVEFHDLMITMEKASTGMALTMQVRNKLLEAYQEIARTQI